MSKHVRKPYKRYAAALYSLFSWGLSVISHIKPLFRFALRVLTHKKAEMKGRILPLNVSIGNPTQATLGRDVLQHLIECSKAVGAMNECMCRAVGGCADFPADLGCLILGEAAGTLHPGIGRAVSREEAMAIVDRALALGLVPMVIHMKTEALLWSLEHSRMLTVCFCCPCHCLIQKALAAQKYTPSSPAPVTGLPGVAVRLDESRCVGCGVCASVCFTGALVLAGGKPSIDLAKCLACGRCAMACARGALVVEAQDAGNAGPVLQAAYVGQTNGGSVFVP